MPAKRTLKRKTAPVKGKRRASPGGKSSSAARKKPAARKSGTLARGKGSSTLRGTSRKPAKSSARTGNQGRKQPSRHKGKSSARQGRDMNPAYYFLCVAMVAALIFMGRYGFGRYQDYARFRAMRDAVDRAGFYDGIVIDGVDVSGLSIDEASRRLAQKDEERRQDLQVTIRCEGRSWTLTADEMDYGSNYLSVARHAYQIGRGGSLEERYAAINETRAEALSYSVSYGYDKTLLRAAVEAVAQEMTVESVNAKVASFDASNRTFSFTGGKEGWRVDVDALYAKVAAAVNARSGESTVDATREKVAPAVTAQMLMEQYGEVSSALTNASSSSSNRLNNIRLALSIINGKRIGPGETFSFNGTVGQRTTQRGFLMAGAYENGTSTEQVGGGICQVSTTLFNAAVKADMTVVERSPHSKPVAYVDKGKDAAVDWPGTDLKFRNDTGEPVYIAAWLSSDKRVHVNLYGRRLRDGMFIKVEAVTTKTISPGADRITYTDSLPAGESKVVSAARYGYKAEAYKIYYTAGGQEIRRELLCRSSYAPAAAIIEMGR